MKKKMNPLEKSINRKKTRVAELESKGERIMPTECMEVEFLKSEIAKDIELLESCKPRKVSKPFGLKYQTIHDDSSWFDNHELFFETEEERDEVYENWGKGLHWDSQNNKELKYPTPQPNYFHSHTIKVNKTENHE
jgi:hypothetical protein